MHIIPAAHIISLYPSLPIDQPNFLFACKFTVTMLYTFLIFPTCDVMSVFILVQYGACNVVARVTRGVYINSDGGC
jgi:hypothetical protein